MERSEDIEALGAEIVWVLTEDVRSNVVGTVDRCVELLEGLKAPQVGWCVGDDATLPEAEAFGESRLANPGYDLIVDRATMKIEVASTHGAGPRNENVNGQAFVDEVRRVVEQLKAKRP